MAVQEETRKLVEAGHIREIQYPKWLSNIVMVKKGQREMDNACPKDSYPLPKHWHPDGQRFLGVQPNSNASV